MKELQTHIAVGNINLDITLRVPYIPGPEENVRAKDLWLSLGGAATNYAIAVAKMGHKAYLVARAGVEAERLGFLERLVKEGVDISYLTLTNEPIGTVIVLITRSRRGWHRSMITLRGANERLSVEMIPKDFGDVVHFGSVVPEILRRFQSNVRMISYDPGGETFRDPEGVRKALGSADVVFMNDKEFSTIALTRNLDEATTLIEGRLKFIIIKLGAKGAVVYDHSGPVSRVEGPKIRAPEDVTGAGDAFDAAFNVYFLRTKDVDVALQYAAAAGAAKVLKRGSSSMPSLEEILKFVDDKRSIF